MSDTNATNVVAGTAPTASGVAAINAALAAPPPNYVDVAGEVDAYIAKLNEDEAKENASKYFNEDGTEKVDEVVEEETAETTEAPEVPDEETKEAPETDEGMKRLMAREEAVRTKEVEFDKKLAEAVRAKLPDFRGKSHEDVLKHFGFDPELALKEMMYQRASEGNPVKAKLKEELRDYHTKKEVESLRADLERRDMESARVQYFQTVDRGAREYVLKVDEKVTPVFAQVAKAKSDYAHARVMQEIVKDAQERLAKGEEGEPLSYADAATRVEKDFAVIADILKGTTKAATQVSAATTSPAKKLNKPIARPQKELTQDQINEMAIQKAIKVYEMEEAKANRTRK